jgi:3',5'-cyclic AMP phosphodiesterase CpdA
MRWRATVVWFLLAACAPAGEATIPTGGVATTTPTTVAPDSSTTSPTPITTPEEPWAVVVVGDQGTGGAAEADVAAAMAEWVGAHPETVALVTTGDNFYVADVAAAWGLPYGWVEASGLQVWAVPGNHDLQSPGQWLAAEQAFGSYPRWRTQAIGGLTFVLLDSNQVDSPEQRAWLERTVAGLGGRPWVAVFHHPMNSCGRHGSVAAVRINWGELLIGARLTLSGHDHDYQRFQTEQGWSVVTGGGGQRLYAVGTCPAGTPEPAASAVAWHFVTVTGRGDRAEVTAYDVSGEILDRFALDLAVHP